MMLAVRRAVGMAFWLSAAGCTHVAFAPASRQGMVLEGLPSTALVYVDKAYWGTGAEVEGMPRAMSAGYHEILIVDSGCQPYYGRIRLKANELVRRRPPMACLRKGTVR